MSRQIFEVMQQRRELLARINAQREQIAEVGAYCQAPLELADKGLAAVRFLRSHPALPAGIAALFVIHRRGMVGLVKIGWRMCKSYRFLSMLSGKLPSRNRAV